jgi:Zn-dependent protease
MINQEPGQKKKGGTILGGLGVVGYALFKFKAAIFGILKFGWLLKGFLSIFVTIAIYSMIFGLPFALVVVVVLFVHELGHWIWMKAAGLNPQMPVLVPFIGAYTAMTEMPPDEVTRAWVAFSGPLIGGIFAAAVYYLGGQTGSSWLMAAGSFGFLLNLIQLIPAKPLDGGFVVNAISRWLLLPGSILLCALALMFHWILFGIIGVISLFSVVKQLFGGQQEPPSTVPASLLQKFLVGVAYLSLTGMLGYLFFLSQTTVMDIVRKDNRSLQLPAQLQKFDREQQQSEQPGEQQSEQQDTHQQDSSGDK